MKKSGERRKMRLGVRKAGRDERKNGIFDRRKTKKGERQ